MFIGLLLHRPTPNHVLGIVDRDHCRGLGGVAPGKTITLLEVAQYGRVILFN